MWQQWWQQLLCCLGRQKVPETWTWILKTDIWHFRLLIRQHRYLIFPKKDNIPGESNIKKQRVRWNVRKKKRIIAHSYSLLKVVYALIRSGTFDDITPDGRHTAQWCTVMWSPQKWFRLKMSVMQTPHLLLCSNAPWTRTDKEASWGRLETCYQMSPPQSIPHLCPWWKKKYTSWSVYMTVF